MNNSAYKYTVCIRCMTYNHEPYIKDALDGFAKQETSFPYVAVIVDDASTDGNQDVILDYYTQSLNSKEDGVSWYREDDYARYYYARHQKNSNCFFAILLLKQNQFGKPSKAEHIQEWESVSKYIALCEGDDFWVDPLKLQKQVFILENNSKLMAVVTNSRIVDKNGQLITEKSDSIVPNNKEGLYSLHDFFRNVHHYPTATVLFRNEHSAEVQRMVSHTRNKFLGDWTLWAILHSFGDFYYLDEETSAYRINPTSLTHTVNVVGRAKANKTICKALSEVLPQEYSPYLKEAGWMYFSVFMAYRKQKRYLPMMSSLFLCFIKYPLYTVKRLGRLVRSREK